MASRGGDVDVEGVDGGEPVDSESRRDVDAACNPVGQEKQFVWAMGKLSHPISSSCLGKKQSPAFLLLNKMS